MAGRGVGRGRALGSVAASPRRLNEPTQFASGEQLREMEDMMLELEEMLREIEDVSSIIEFNATSTGASDGNASLGRGLFRAAGSGATVLATQVGEDLKKWHERNEMNVVEYGSEHAERLRSSVREQRAEQETREYVRNVVRDRLFDIASQCLADNSEEVTIRNKKQFSGKGIEVGNSLEAQLNLKSRLEATVNPLFDLRGEPPQDMLAAMRSSRWAVERKRQRSGGRRHRMQNLESWLDETLMDEAEESMGQRKKDLYEQCELQRRALMQLEEAQEDREEANDAFDQLVKAGCTSETDPWKILWPSGLAQDHPVGAALANVPPSQKPVRDADGKPVMPQLGLAVEEAIVATLTPQLMNQGGVRIHELRSDFYHSYLAKDSGERARMVGSELEKWQLNTKLELLKELMTMSQSTHKGIMQQLRQSLSFQDDAGSTDHLQRTLTAAEDFHSQRQQFFEEQVDSAETAISTFCSQSIQQLLSLRRRTELASLKRWADVQAGLNSSLDVSWVKCQCQLADQVRMCLADCHQGVKLPVEKLDIERGRKQVENISVAWKRCGTHVPVQLSFLETLTKAVPDTVESCAVTKAALSLLEAELERLIARLKETPRND